MPEEFWLTHMRAPHVGGATRLWTYEWTEGLKDVAHARVDALPLETWADPRLADALDYAARSDILERFYGGEAEHGELVTELRDALHAAVDAVWPLTRSLEGSEVTRLPDELVSLTIGGVEYWFTGGITSGEVPTDIWDSVQVLSRVDLFAEPLEVVALRRPAQVEAPPEES
jgi:hypothetical protein